MSVAITRQNIDKMLDAGELYAAMNSGRWHKLRRNGATKTWKRDVTRIRVPFKYGLYGYGAITESDFLTPTSSQRFHGELPYNYYRHVDDVPSELRPS